MGSKVSQEEVNRCISLLAEIEAGKDKSQVLAQIQPTVLRMRHGKVLYSQIQKLVMANNTERAMKLLAVAPRGGGGIFKLGSVLSPILIAAAVFLGSPLMPRCDGAYEPAIAALNACPSAVAMLGGNIQQAYVGMACGSSETSGSYGRSNWKIPVKGDRGSGSYEYGGRNNGQGWQLDYGRLRVGDQIINIWPCATGGATAVQALTMATAMTGTVSSVAGAAAVQPGTPCTITLSPTPEAATQRGFNCHIKVQCANAVIYGWEGSGYTSCQLAAGRPMSANDAQGASAGDDPMLALNVNARTCTVSDDGQNAFSVVISLTGGV